MGWALGRNWTPFDNLFVRLWTSKSLDLGMAFPDEMIEPFFDEEEDLTGVIVKVRRLAIFRLRYVALEQESNELSEKS